MCIASDHAGFQLKESIKNSLINRNISIIDLGPMDKNSVDYPDYAKKVSNRVKSKKSDVGILVCGSGIGMSISANKTIIIGQIKKILLLLMHILNLKLEQCKQQK